MRSEGLDLLDHLSESIAEDFLLSPTVCSLLRTAAPWTGILQLLRTAAFESEGGRFPECSADAGGGHPLPSAQTAACAAPWHGLSVVPRLRWNVALDHTLPLQPGIPSAGLLSPQLPAGDVLRVELSRLDEAVCLLDSLGTGDWQLCGRQPRHLVLRHEPSRPNDCWGASSGIAIGRVVLVNVTAVQDLRMLAEILLHECVHVALDRAELVQPLWDVNTATHSLSNITLPSPWSGNPLTCHALVHATVVWAVLGVYWKVCEVAGRGDETSRGRLTYIANGFTRLREQETAMQPVFRTLNPLAMQVMQAAVGAYTACMALYGQREPTH